MLLKKITILSVPGRLWCTDDMRLIVQAYVIITSTVVAERNDNFFINNASDERPGDLHLRDNKLEAHGSEL